MKWFRHDVNMNSNRKIRKLIRVHGATGYAFWCILLEKIYLAEGDFQIQADELWFEDISEDLRLGDYRTPIRILDTLSELGLISSQLWQEHVIFLPAVAERGDAYLNKRVAETEKKRKQRENKISLSPGDKIGTKGQKGKMSPSDPDADLDPKADTERDPITRADPYRADTEKSADAERVCEEVRFEKVSEPEPEQAEPLSSITPTPDLLEKHGISRVGEFSGGVVSQSTQNFNDRWNHSINIAPLTDELIRLYNNGKPDNWTGIPGDCRAARKAIENKINRLVKDGRDLSEIPKLMQNALLHCQSNDFYKKKEFGSGDIYWLCKDDRVEIAASKFQGSSESAKRKVATAILERENGIKHWEDGHVMRETEIHCAKRAIPKMRFDYPGLPPLEWVRKNMPDILKKLSPDYPEYPQKEELNYACN